MRSARRGAVVAAALMLCAASDLTAQSAEDEVRGMRRASNAALASGDVEGFMASIDSDYVGTGGSGGHTRSRDELRALIESIFSDTPGRHFVRSTAEVEVAPSGARAIESGRWVAVDPAIEPGREPVGGRYTAYWRMVDGAWRIHAEVFVTLSGGDRPLASA